MQLTHNIAKSMPKLSELIRGYREIRRLTQADLAKSLGLEKPISISNWERGESPVPWHHFEGLIETLRIPRKEFLRAATEAVPDAVKSYERYVVKEGPPRTYPSLSPPSTRSVPVINDSACGKWRDFTDLEFPAGHADRYELAPTKDPHAFYVIANGDSMIGGEIRAGDLLLVEPSKRVDDGNIVLAKTDDGMTVKKLFRHHGQVELRPMNEAHKSLIVQDDPSLKVYRITRITKQV